MSAPLRPDCIAPTNCVATGHGHCRVCRKIYLDNHPEVRAKISAARKKAWADPEVRARISEASKKALADPEVRAKISAARKKALADKNSWCPPHLYDEYRFLVSRLGKNEAREIIERQLGLAA